MGVQDIFTSLSRGSCLALCYSKWLLPGALLSDHMQNVILGWRKDYIADDGTVLWPDAYLHLIDPQGRTFRVSWGSGLSRSDPFPTFYSADGKDGHFVLASEVKGIVWDPLDNSFNARYGVPRNHRIIEVIGNE